MKDQIRRLWHDPVWSKVISAAIIGSVVLIGTAVSNRYDWLQEATNISRFTAIVFLVLLVPANLVWVFRLARAIRRQDSHEITEKIIATENTPEGVETAEPSQLVAQEFEPEEREVEILQFLFNETRSTPVSTIQSKFFIQNRQEALYYLERLRRAQFIRGPQKYAPSGTINGYAILQRGREYVVKNSLILR